MLTEEKLVMNYPLVVHSELSDEVQDEAVEILVNCYEKYPTHLETAAKAAKDALDAKFGSSWNCCLGNFDFTIEHSGQILFLYINGTIGALLFKC
ncbi:hypothetical protein P9112_011976 [Eukaryota sp. TZLM1-RC]